ncbi:hypothetical protein FFLO_06946 [Filobasidium floriforme]|uniref:Uncharacterized protein n=1 Tax=Filobasidium floriforme TaxID=5210 RepID=A0A8K0NMJ4_9TREE|nr:uncharacterized protein HD553DRAFT_322742 [Filobasidium floriforme]KAG7527425.1 hypothetical protein FFLO_06946 [Filobasidium floriforme]KAH8087232.1 hypothetical protein HD553DRAFT_322742 [Filobasidium floriforme]
MALPSRSAYYDVFGDENQGVKAYIFIDLHGWQEGSIIGHAEDFHRAYNNIMKRVWRSFMEAKDSICDAQTYIIWPESSLARRSQGWFPPGDHVFVKEKIEEQLQDWIDVFLPANEPIVLAFVTDYTIVPGTIMFDDENIFRPLEKHRTAKIVHKLEYARTPTDLADRTEFELIYNRDPVCRHEKKVTIEPNGDDQMLEHHCRASSVADLRLLRGPVVPISGRAAEKDTVDHISFVRQMCLTRNALQSFGWLDLFREARVYLNRLKAELIERRRCFELLGYMMSRRHTTTFSPNRYHKTSDMRPPSIPRSSVTPKPPKPFFRSSRRDMEVFDRKYGVMDMEAHVFLDLKAWHKKLKEDDTKPLEAAQKHIMQRVWRSLVASGDPISAIHTQILKPNVPRSGDRHDAYHRNLARFLPGLKPIVIAIVTDYEVPKHSSGFSLFF